MFDVISATTNIDLSSQSELGQLANPDNHKL